MGNVGIWEYGDREYGDTLGNMGTPYLFIDRNYTTCLTLFHGTKGSGTGFSPSHYTKGGIEGSRHFSAIRTLKAIWL